METNFKVDVPSFALGYSEGKKKIPPAQEKEITVTKNGTTEVTPDEGKLLSKVVINTQTESIDTNLYFSEDTPPEDTTKIWVKCPEPDKVSIKTSTAFITSIGYKSTIFANAANVLPYRVYYAGVAAYGKTIYLFGGTMYNTETSKTESTNKIIAYDTETMTGRVLEATLPVGVTLWYSCWTIGEYIYILNKDFGLLRFDPSTEQLKKTDFVLEDEEDYRGASVGNKIYLISKTANTLHLLDVDDLTITALCNTGIASTSAAVVAVDKYIYIIADAGIACYDTVLGTMTLKREDATTGSSNALKNNMCVFSAGGREIFIAGAYGNATVYRYDIFDNNAISTTYKTSWTLETARYGQYMSAVVIGETVYVLGGKASSGSGANDYSNTVQTVVLPLGEVQAEPNELVLYVNQTYGFVQNIIDANWLRAELAVGRYFLGDGNGVGKAVSAYMYKSGKWQLAFRRY